MLTRQQIIDALDLKTETVSVPEWGGDLVVSTMSGHARDQWEVSVRSKDGTPDLLNARAKLVAACVVNGDGKLMFTAEDVEALAKKSSIVLDRIATVAYRLNKLGESDVKELEGN